LHLIVTWKDGLIVAIPFRGWKRKVFKESRIGVLERVLLSMFKSGIFRNLFLLKDIEQRYIK
jgi:hypothetical protein